MKVFFVDTNILVDLAIAREPFDEDAKQLFRSALQEKVRLLTTPIALSTTLYWLQKSRPADAQLAEKARRLIRFFVRVVELAAVSKEHFIASADSGFLDLEDGTQYAAAAAYAKLDALVT